MKARDLTPACIGRRIRVERDHPLEGKLTSIVAYRGEDGYLDMIVTIGDWAVMLDADEPVTITG